VNAVIAKRNLTIQLDEDIIRKARAAATRRGMSVSGLVARQLHQLAVADARYEEAKRSALEFLSEIAQSTAHNDRAEPSPPRSWQREDLHEEQLNRYDQ
jgi:hypothetical protein